MLATAAGSRRAWKGTTSQSISGRRVDYGDLTAAVHAQVVADVEDVVGENGH